jgi:hypothetical protein
MRLPLVCLLVLLFLGSARAGEPFFQKNDVIALIGGEDMVVAGEDGYLELLLLRALPDYHLRFRSLAFEGDTVFEQNRELNFPTLEESLDKVGATVVICQFGQMESLAGKDKIPDFIAAYEQFLNRLSGDGKRRIIVVTPTPFSRAVLDDKRSTLDVYSDAIADLASRHAYKCLNYVRPDNELPFGVETRDKVHLTNAGQWTGAEFAVDQLGVPYSKAGLVWTMGKDGGTLRASVPKDIEDLRQLIVAKNRLWYDYWRVQNWAFLAGDRTNQPSSRDWKDPSKRWFPAEREEFIPLIESKEKEIDALAAKLK